MTDTQNNEETKQEDLPSIEEVIEDLKNLAFDLKIILLDEIINS